VKWYNYPACFFAGVCLIHVVPHLLGGMSAINIAGVLVSLGGGGLLLWAGRFSLRNGWAIVVVPMGMASVLIFAALHPHQPHRAGGRHQAGGGRARQRRGRRQVLRLRHSR
jgi:hypothetical protein